jgi:acrylyl-CoA reductase (NADPH)
MADFRAWRVSEKEGQFSGEVTERRFEDLPAGDALIRVDHSSLNFKDALSASGNKGVTREFPHTPGIDAAGEVVRADGSEFPPGAKVIVTGYDLGMNTDGGFGEYIRVPASWCVNLPGEWTSRTAMAYGTAGLTAALCIDKLLHAGLETGQGPVLVTGASGGVGSVAVELLSKLGFEVVAVSGKVDQAEALESLGAARVEGRDLLEESKKPVLKPEFAGAVDTVGGSTLAEIIKRLKPAGSVAACGLAGGTAVPTAVFPFILRGVNLLGVDSVEIPLEKKQAMWQKLAGDWRCEKTEAQAREIGFDELPEALSAFLKGQARGRVVLAHSHQ